MREPTRCWVSVLTFFIVLGVLCSFSGATALASPLQLTPMRQEIVGEGTTLHHYQLQIGIHLIPVQQLVVDLRNPYVEIRAMKPEEGFNARQTVRQMVRSEQAVAAINADLFHMDRPAAPFGLHIENQKILSSPTYNASWMGFAVNPQGVARIENWTFQGTIVVDGVHHQYLYGYNQTFHSTHELLLYDRQWGKEVSATFFRHPVLQVRAQNGIVIDRVFSDQPASIPPDGFLLLADGEASQQLIRNAQLGSRIDYQLGILPSTDLNTAIGGHVLLVEGGRPREVSQLPSPGALRAPRTAVGIDTSGRHVSMVTVGGTSGLSGVTMGELAILMSRLGSDRALNLDGGGSSTMAARRLGNFHVDLINQPSAGFERSIPNALGVFNIAPVTPAHRLFLRGEQAVLEGCSLTLSVTGHDRHYHPVTVDPVRIQWSSSDPARATVSNGTIHAQMPGEVVITARYQDAQESHRVTILGSEDIKDVIIAPTRIQLLPGQTVPLSVKVTTIQGATLPVDSGAIHWQSDRGQVKDSVFVARPGEGAGELVATVSGHTARIPVHIGGRRVLLTGFEDAPSLQFRSHPDQLPGQFILERDPLLVQSGSTSGRLEYTFPSDREGVLIAYGWLGSTPLSIGSDNLGLSAYVFGDASGYWLRAELFDANGTRRYLDLARSINWTGWQQVEGVIDAQWPQPLQLASIYLVQEPHLRSPNRPESGAIILDQIEMIKGLSSGPSAAQPRITMWVDSKNYQIGQTTATMDAAPFIQDRRTFVPVRFVSEALGARVDFTSDPATGRTTSVSVHSAHSDLTLFIGEPLMHLVDHRSGQSRVIPLDVVPLIVNQRVFVPIRAIGEEGFQASVGFTANPATGRVHEIWIE